MNSDSIEVLTGYRRLPHFFAVACALVVFPLIWMGGLVTTSDAGMAVPDWPNTYGYNLFLYPIRDWFFGPWDLFVEHGHRLLGSLAGFIAILLVISAFWRSERRWFRKLTVAALLLVITQGALGGARVVLDQRMLALVHGCVGPLFFAMIAGTAAVSSKWWFSVDRSQTSESQKPDWTIALGFAAILLSYIQLIVGANLRHIADFAAPSVYQTLVLSHIGLAIIICLLATMIFAVSRQKKYQCVGIRALAMVLLLLVATQFCLGVSTWVFKYGVPHFFGLENVSERFLIKEKSFLQMNIVTGHVAVGSLILATATCWTVRCLRLFRPISEHTLTTN